MRLIDADEFKEQVIGAALKDGTCNVVEIADALVNLIDTQPTAYDVDKVVEQLERMKKPASCPPKYVKKPCIGDTTCERCKMTYAVEIVKAGGTDT